jgi:hypothetical protein
MSDYPERAQPLFGCGAILLASFRKCHELSKKPFAAEFKVLMALEESP